MDPITEFWIVVTILAVITGMPVFVFDPGGFGRMRMICILGVLGLLAVGIYYGATVLVDTIQHEEWKLRA